MPYSLRLQASGLLDSLYAAAKDVSSPAAREGALLVVDELCQAVGSAVEPFVVPALLATILERLADKVRVWPLMDNLGLIMQWHLISSHSQGGIA